VIVDALGAGGTGQVYGARDIRLGRLVALRFGNDPHEIARFQREAQVLASKPSGIAAIHGLEDCNGIQVFSMELVEGPAPVERLANGRFSFGDHPT